MGDSAFRMKFEGLEKMAEALKRKRSALIDAAYDGLLAGSLKIRGTIVASFGTAGKPRRVTGRMSRGVREYTERLPTGARSVIGMAATVPQARILEKGGTQPARVIVPKKARALRWLTGQSAGFYRFALSSGATYKQATRVAMDPKLGGGSVAFARRVSQPSRYQKAMPYFEPAFQAEREGIEKDLLARMRAALRS